MADLDSGWGTTSGLPDNVWVTVTDASFTFDEKVDATKLFLKWDVVAYEGLEEGQNLDEIRWTCGADWTTDMDGTIAIHPRDHKKFNNSSRIGMLIDWVIANAREGFEGQPSPLYAGVWIGTEWHLERKTGNFTTREGVAREFSYLFPVEYLGRVSGVDEAVVVHAPVAAEVPRKAAAGSKKAVAKKTANSIVQQPWVALDGETLGEITAIATSAGSYDEFKTIVSQTWDIEDRDDPENQALLSAVDDDRFYLSVNEI